MPEMGLEILVRVNGFHDAKDWMYRLVRAHIVRCTSPMRSTYCDHPATRIFWQDRAEWYPCCDAHWVGGDMWTGSTRWNPDVLSMLVLPEPARAWVAALPEAERPLVRLHEYDRTDYYALLKPGEEPKRIYLVGTNGAWFEKFVNIHALTDGRFAYEIVQQWSSQGSGTSHFYGLVGGFQTADEARRAAEKESKRE